MTSMLKPWGVAGGLAAVIALTLGLTAAPVCGAGTPTISRDDTAREFLDDLFKPNCAQFCHLKMEPNPAC